ncbi:MAG: DGQHR domain-containing protein DpdB [Planctomycetota bacterium]|nr:DGQHR domain-containing protein DpdB [Planctomycetota bacterium]
MPALEVRQGTDRRLYSFAVDGKSLHEFCTVSRVSRQNGKGLDGYQRPEVVSHITQIREYLESENPLLPNAIVVAFDGTVKFRPAPGRSSGCSRAGTLEIPINEDIPDEQKPGWIVDGQQRAAALRDARVDSFPVCVVGFVAEGLEEQRQQFILVNATKPLPKGLIYELLPGTEGKLPLALQKRRYPALLSERLNYDEDSPLCGLIRTPTNGNGLIADNSILKMLENSLSDGVLYCYDDLEEQLQLLKCYWSAVSTVFPEAWGKPPRQSRLMHGAGFVAMGFLMDTIADRHRRKANLTQRMFAKDLEPLKEICRWTEGHWQFGPDDVLKWNELQNVPRHIQMLSNHLLYQFRILVGK